MKFIVLFFLLLGMVPGWGQVNREGDFQLWLYQSLRKKFNKCFNGYVDGELRYGDDASKLYLFYIQGGVFYTVNPCLEIAPGYRQQFVFDFAARKWRPVYQPLIDLYLKKAFKKWEFTDRNRFSILIFDSGPSRLQYRNRLTIKTPWMFGPFNLLGFEEVFFREREGYCENRLGAGGVLSILKKTQATLSYMLRHQKIDSSWFAHHVLWLQFLFQF